MRLSRAGLALLGFGLTIALASAGATIYTFVKELHNETRITRIEGVIGLGQRQAARSRHPTRLQANSKEVQILEVGGDALQPASNAGQPPAPPTGGEQEGSKPPKGSTGHHPAPAPAEDGSPETATTSQPPIPAGDQAETGNSAGGDQETSASENHPVAEAAGHVLESTGEAATGVLCGATDRLQLQTNC